MPTAAQYCIAYEMRLVTEHIWPGKLKKRCLFAWKSREDNLKHNTEKVILQSFKLIFY